LLNKLSLNVGDLLYNDFFSIGEASRLCNVSRKTLRFYDEIGLISPDVIGENGYRYYSRDTLLLIPVVKYYKQMGFKLDEMRDFVNGSTYPQITDTFKHKIEELQAEAVRIREHLISVADWYDLIVEAGVVIETKSVDVGVKYFGEAEMCCLKQPYNSCPKDAIINIEFTNFIESINNEITGPVWRHFDSWRDKVTDRAASQRMLQKTIRPCAEEHIYRLNRALRLSCYHIGTHKNLGDTYDKMYEWAQRNCYRVADDSYERYVIDYWTSYDVEKYVTEVIIDISR
jgi:DNA-binding transcriptional MerR regulator